MEERNTPKMLNTFNLDIHTAIHDADNNPSVFLNFHNNLEIVIALEGFFDCEINGQKYRVSKGEAIFICPLQLHSFTVGEGSSVRRITFHHHIILTISQSLEGRIPQNPVFRPNKNTLKIVADFIDKTFGHDSGLIQRIRPFETRMKVKGFLYVLTAEFLESAKLIPTPKNDTLTMDIAQYISDNFKRNISLNDIAKEKGYNCKYLSRVFNSVMDINFKKMLNLFRIEYAHHLLQDTNISITQICFESGFQSIRSFNQVCIDTFGKSPSELRKGKKFETAFTKN